MMDPERLAALAEEFGTPLYAYDFDEMEERGRRLRASLPARVELAYAVKANPSIAVLTRLAAAGLGADVASGGELAAVERAGFPAEAIVFTGPGKRDVELAAAVRRPLRAITVESPGELRRLRAAARDASRPVAVMLRAAGEPRPGNVIGSGGGRFGMRREDLLDAARFAAASPELDLVGVHRFDASNVLDADEIVDHARRTVALAAEVADAARTPLALVDLGGGLGIPYAATEPELDLGRLGPGLAAVMEDLAARHRLEDARLILEPGRWIVGPAGAYVTRVVDVKEGADGTVVTVDGGVHHMLRPALIGHAHRIRALGTRPADRPSRRVLVGGPLCTSLDVLGHADLPDPRPGDLLSVADAGAYGFTESMPYFLSHPSPPEIGLTGDRAFVARRRVEPDELQAWQSSGA